MTSKDRKARPERPAYAGRQPRKPRPAKAAPSSAAAPATGKATGNATRNATGNATGNAAPKAGKAAPVSPWALANATASIRRLHQVAVGASLIVAPLAATAGQALLIPVRGRGPSLAAVAGQLDSWRAAHGLLLVDALLMLVALLGLGRLLHTRDQIWGTGGAAVAVVGLLGALGITIVDLVVAEMAALGGGGQLDVLLGSIGRLLYWLDLTEDLLMLGLVLLMLGLLRTRSVPPWAAILVLTGLAVPYVTPALLVIANGIQLAGLGWIGVSILRRPAERWAEPPEYDPLPRPGLVGWVMSVLYLPGAVSAARFLALTSVFVGLVIYRQRPAAAPDPAPPPAA